MFSGWIPLLHEELFLHHSFFWQRKVVHVANFLYFTRIKQPAMEEKEIRIKKGENDLTSEVKGFDQVVFLHWNANVPLLYNGAIINKGDTIRKEEPFVILQRTTDHEFVATIQLR